MRPPADQPAPSPAAPDSPAGPAAGPRRRATIEDVARAAGLSVSTVDRVLNARAPVRADTAEQVRQAAEALDFRGAAVIRERVRGGRQPRTFGFLLLGSEPAFYRRLAQALCEAVEAEPTVRGRALVAYMADIAPDAVSDSLLEMGRRVDAVAVVAADHPQVSAAVEQLRARGVPTFALMHDLSAPGRAGCISVDWRRVGRTAAWFLTRLAPRPGRLALFVGSHRYQGQELCEMSFRAYVRAHAPQFEVLEALVTLENERMAGEILRELLHRESELVGFYVAGGGLEGVLQALQTERAADSPAGAAGTELIGACHELTEISRLGLLRGQLHLVQSHPLPALARQAVQAMARALAPPQAGLHVGLPIGLQQHLLPMDLHTPESV